MARGRLGTNLGCRGGEEGEFIWVNNSRVARFTIKIDDGLVKAVIRRYGLKNEQDAVDLALRRLVGAPLTTNEVLGLEGSGWDGNLARIRRRRFS